MTNLRFLASALAGGLWNLGSLWCLANLLRAWIAPSRNRRQALGWLAAKCAWLAVLLVGVLPAPWISLIGFGIGFTAALMLVVAWLGLRAAKITQPHGR